MISPFRRPRPDRSSHVVNKIACKSSDFKCCLYHPLFLLASSCSFHSAAHTLLPVLCQSGRYKTVAKDVRLNRIPAFIIVCIGDMFHMSNKLKETESIHQKHIRKLHWFISESFRRDHELNKFYNRFRKAHWKRKAIEYLQSQGRRKKSKEISKYRKGCKDR